MFLFLWAFETNSSKIFLFKTKFHSQSCEEEREMKKLLISTDNIFEDLNLKNPKELKARSDLMSEVVSTIRNSEFAQKEIAKILGISAPKVSALLKGKINDFSNEILVHYLTLLPSVAEKNPCSQDG